jgi:hypothetical protein
MPCHAAVCDQCGWSHHTVYPCLRCFRPVTSMSWHLAQRQLVCNRPQHSRQQATTAQLTEPLLSPHNTRRRHSVCQRPHPTSRVSGHTNAVKRRPQQSVTQRHTQVDTRHHSSPCSSPWGQGSRASKSDTMHAHASNMQHAGNGLAPAAAPSKPGHASWTGRGMHRRSATHGGTRVECHTWACWVCQILHRPPSTHQQMQGSAKYR